MVCKSGCAFQKVPFFPSFIHPGVCLLAVLPLHVFLSPCTTWGKGLHYVYNSVGFPSSKPAINPNHCYFFIAGGTFHTLHGGSSATHLTVPFPLCAASRALPEHTEMINTTSHSSSSLTGLPQVFSECHKLQEPCKGGELQACPSWVGPWACRVCGAVWGQALSDVECSALPLPLAPVAMAVVCPVINVWITAHSPWHLQQELELFSRHGWGDAGSGATTRADAPAQVSSPPQLPALLLSPAYTHSSKGGETRQILIIALWVPKPYMLDWSFYPWYTIGWWAEEMPSEVAFISADTEWTRYVS